MTSTAVPVPPAGFRSGAATAAHRIENGSAEADTVGADGILTRTPKDSYRWYRDLISAHCAVRKGAR
jgi:hypothetical protein